MITKRESRLSVMMIIVQVIITLIIFISIEILFPNNHFHRYNTGLLMAPKYFENIKDVIEDKVSFEKEYFGAIS